LKILFLSYTYWPPDFGGELLISIERFMSLMERGHQITVLTSGRPGLSSHHREAKFRIMRSPIIGTSRLERLFRRIIFLGWACGLLLRIDYDVLHIGSVPGIGPASNALSVWLLCGIVRLRRLTSVFVYNLADTEQAILITDGLEKIWKKIFYANLHRVVAVSPALYNSMKNQVADKVTLIVNAVRDDLFQPLSEPERKKVRREMGKRMSDVVFCFLGTLGYRKGFDMVAQAFSELVGNNPNWHLWVIGPSTRAENQNLDPQEVSEYTELLQYVKANVTYIGRVNDRKRLAHLVGSADVFVFPSRREGFGLAPVEAMSAGVPVIVSRIPGVTDVANIEGVTGYYIASGNTEQLKSIMMRLGKNYSLRKEMGQNAAIRVRRCFSWQKHIDQWESLYVKLASNNN